MIRMLGAILVAGGCFMMGEKQTRRLRDRVTVLTGLVASLEHMERELRLRLPSLPTLMKSVSLQADESIRPLFEESGRALDGLREVSFADVWPRLVEQISSLNGQDRFVLNSLGPILGRYDGPGQGDAIAAARGELQRQRERAQEEYTRLGRLYRVVGAAGGGFLIILLL